jgi:endonuclease/exonuclease/phosphatase (EEP) superfamily protein YafD
MVALAVLKHSRLVPTSRGNGSMIDLAPAQAPAARVPLGRLAKAVRIVSLLDLAAVALATGVLWLVSERTWWGSLFTFLPRHAFLVAPVLLLFVSLFTDRRSILINLAGAALVAGPLMGGRIPLAHIVGGHSPETGITIVSCNVQCFEPDFESVLREIKALSPDVVAFQEAIGESPLLSRYFPGWHLLQEDQYWIGSRYPVHRLDLCNTGVFPRPTAFSVRIDAPGSPFVLHDVHLTTPRYGFLKLTWHSVLDGSGPRYLESHTERRLAEALRARAYVDRIDANGDDHPALPAIIAGDFNTPSVSQLYRAAWPGFTNAFNETGFGFGYTAPCTNHRHWFDDVPWVRIDHILADDHWSVSACGVGRSKGSDHRLIWTILSLRK